ncbi:MAG: hypothetical protein DDT19_02573 [Syntrophomonadaceae bacterium]|nr:hypothetical protein [Bacillota bacterium]
MGLFAFLSGLVAKIFASRVAEFTAWKVLLFFLFVTILPVILMNAWSTIIEYTFDVVFEIFDTFDVKLPDFTIELAGLAGWLANALLIEEGLAIILSAVFFRVMLRSIPLLRL